MKSLKILVVEDEILIAKTIQIYLQDRQHLVLGLAISYDEAVHAYRLRRPDLVLLDIRLYGEKSGIDFANFLRQQEIMVPFLYLTSQFDERIMEIALLTNPYGYLVKPFRKESLWTAVESSYNLYLSSSKQEKEPHLLITDGKNNYSLKPSEIIYIQADHVYLKIFVKNGKEIMIRKSLLQFLQEFPNPLFINCHRSYIINKIYITSWNQDVITMNHKICITISRTRKAEILAQIEQE